MVVGDGATQLVDLSSSTKSCQNWNDYPVILNYASGSIVSGSPMVCGGWSVPEQGLSVFHTECYLLDFEKKSWKFLTNMTSERNRFASAEVNGSLFVVAGSYHSTTEYITKNGIVSAGPNLPYPLQGHCMVKLPSGKLMIMGGTAYYDRLNNVFTLNPHDNSSDTSVPSMIYARQRAGCAIFNSPAHDLRPVVLAVGGMDLATAEVFDYTKPSSKWTKSKINYVF